MQKNKIPLFLLSGLILLMNSCAKEGPTGPIGPAGPAYTGTVSGHVSLYDQYGNKVLNKLDSISILLSSNVVIVTADTIEHPDINGAYIYTNLASAEYSISAADTGYGATTTNGFQFLIGTFNKDIALSAIPTFSLTFTAYQDTITQNDSLVINCTPSEQARSCVIFVNNTISIAAGESYILSYVKNIPANATQMVAIINGQELYSAGFVHDARIYYTVFSHSVNDQSAYEDQATGKTVFTAVSNPTIDSTFVP